jgi:Fe-S-cluster-containing dehydrogenase component/CRP-like cAMP-binding protein
VWQSQWLRELDAAGRAQVEAAGALRRLVQGARVFALGDLADAFFVVGEGLVDLRAVRRGDAEASALRRAIAGDAVGEEALVRLGARRAAEAVCATSVVVAEVPVAVFRRAAERVGAARAAELEGALRRAAARDAVRASSLGRALPAREIDAIVEAAEPRALGQGEVIAAQGDPATHAYVVVDGLLQIRTEDDGRARVRAYLGRGDVVADPGLESGAPCEVTVAACGPAWVLALPRERVLRAARRAPDVLARARRVASSPPLPEGTRHVLGDLWRFAVAGSMLVIDDEACVRCGQCAWACADAHDDGVSRLVRRGEKVTVRSAADGSTRALVVPGSCQHCKHPACMVDCPTGAIGRDPRGEVFVRAELCVGCGHCVKACPWGSVHMAPRAGDAKRKLPLAPSEQVAVKCDLCREVAEGPACVRACPVDAIARIEPQAAIAEVRRAVGATRPRAGLPDRRAAWAAWPSVLGAAIVALSVARTPMSAGGARLASGAAAAALVVALAAYGVVKRRVKLGLSRRAQMILHLSLGALAAGTVAAHTQGHAPPNAAGALLVAFAAATALGALGAAAYALVPGALSRVERRALLAEDLPARARELDDRVFGALTGRSEATKAVYARMLAPYARAPLGALALVARRATLRDEEARLKRGIEEALGARAARLDGIDDLVRLAVERRAVKAQRVLQATLRAWVPAHAVAAAIAVVLLVVHVVCVLRGP